MLHVQLVSKIARSIGRFLGLNEDLVDALLEREKQVLRDIRPDLIVANIPYLTLAAAQQLGIPNLAFCSLNWAELYQHFFAARPEAAPILEELESFKRTQVASIGFSTP